MKLLATGIAAFALAASTIPTGGGPVAFEADCDLGEVRWEYTNLGDEPVTLTKGRVVLPKKLGAHPDTTLIHYQQVLEPGETRFHGVSGIIWIRDGVPQPEEDLPDGRYRLNLWFDDGVTKWRVNVPLRKQCS